jgi:hypothetical protein
VLLSRQNKGYVLVRRKVSLYFTLSDFLGF